METRQLGAWGLNAQGVGKLAIFDRKRRFCRKRFKIMSMVTMVTEKTIGKLGTTEGRNSLPLASNFGSIYFLIIVSINQFVIDGRRSIELRK